MHAKKHLVLALAAAVAAAWGLRAEAKDLFYFLGYEGMQVIDGDTDRIVARVPVRGWIREAALTSDKRALYVVTNRHVVQKVALPDHKVVSSFDVSGDGWQRFVFGFCLGPDDKTAYAAIMSRRTEGGEVILGKPVVAEISLETGRILRTLEVPWGVGHLVAVKGGRWVYAFGKDLYKIDASGPELKVAETMPMFEKKWNILPFWDYPWENGGRSLVNYYTPELMGLLQVDQATGEITDMPLKGDPILAYSIVRSPDGKKGYAVMDDLNVIDLVSRTYGPAVPIAEGTSYGVSISSDGKKLYVGAGGSTVTVYDARTLKPIKVLRMASDAMDIRRVTF